MNIYECDVCGKQFSDKTKIRSVHIQDTISELGKNYDFCVNCITNLKDWISKSRVKQDK